MTYEERAAACLDGSHTSASSALKGIGWALLAIAEAIRPEPAQIVELTHEQDPQVP